MMKRITDSLAVTMFAVGTLVAGANLLAGCAGWGKTSCQVVDAAAQACTVVRFMGDDGKMHEVPLTPQEAQEVGKSKAAKMAAEKKAAEKK